MQLPESDISHDSASHTRRAGDIVFATGSLAAALVLVSQIGTQTAWINGVKIVAQPRFWPAVSLIGMCLFAAGYLWGAVSSRHKNYENLRELTLWLRSIEYAVWFMAYVWLVPIIGYLFSTVIFAALLVLRAGYRDARMVGAAVAIGIAITVIFKSFLAVKIPGGQLYQHLPDALRNFMTLYL